MTFKEAMIQQMTKRGMFLQQAEQVMDKEISENKNELMEGRWLENISDYPEGLVNIVWIGVKKSAYEWIEENAPMAWFKPMFQYTNEELQKMIDEKKHS